MEGLIESFLKKVNKMCSNFTNYQSDQSLYDIFRRFDRDGTGHIEYRELINILSIIEPHRNSEALRSLIRNDYNRDGRLNFNEFKEFYHNYRQY